MFISEPVRAYLYPILVAIIGVLVAYGIIDSEQAAVWTAVGVAVLGVAGVETARSKVTPVAK